MQQEFEAAAVKLKGREARLADFTNQTGLRRDRYREQVFSTPTENGLRGFGKSVSGKAVYQAQEYYDVWRKSIGADSTPKTLAKYYEMKYNDKAEYARLQKYILSYKAREASPLLGYTEYSAIAKRIEESLVGVCTTNGIEIIDYSAHFVCRAIGHSSTKKKFNKDSPSIDEIREALTHGTLGKTQTDKRGELSIVFIGKTCAVTVNPTKKSLVQTNLL